MSTLTASQSTKPPDSHSVPSTPRWTRTSGPESAFGGLSRGRGGRGGGRGSGGNAGRRGGANRDALGGLGVATSKHKNGTSKQSPILPPRNSVSTPSSSSTAPNVPLAKISLKPRPQSRRASKNVPSPPVEKPLESPSSSSHSRNRRRRSYSHKHSVPQSKTSLSPNGLMSPSNTAPLPTISKDIRNDLDTLVERVRAAAMGENRPHTPGSHIDWAGDDDDSLPDLDDWGITPIAPAEKDINLMSPIIMDGLKSLPELAIKPPSPLGADQPPHSEPHSLPTDKSCKATNAQKKPLLAPNSCVIDMHEVEGLNSPPEQGSPRVSFGVHQNAVSSSLPPKPRTPSNLSAFLPSSRRRPSATRMQATVPLKPPEFQGKIPPNTEQPMTVDANIQGLSDDQKPIPVHLPASAEKEIDAREDEDENRPGLAASIHAPKSPAPGADSVLPQSPGTHLELLQRGHARGQTLGRPLPRPDQSPRFSRSGYSSPKRGHLAGNHFRTQSTPPAGSSERQRAPHQRPVITGDAISRLARTIGATANPTAKVQSTVVTP